ncbi:MAG: hypothetical protein JNJ80_22680 [Gemmatimonadetes bacterium]|nr:hypothetical protein [Gemmatimonadota bacterium]
MFRPATASLLLLILGTTTARSLAGQSQAPAKVAVCSLLTKQEVRTLLPWKQILDMEPEEEAIGTTGSSCNYPSVMIQVLPTTSGIIEVARKRGGLETLSGIGLEAYFYHNPNGYAEIYVKAAKHVVTVQANVQDNLATVKPGAINLAKALVGKLR